MDQCFQFMVYCLQEAPALYGVRFHSLAKIASFGFKLEGLDPTIYARRFVWTWTLNPNCQLYLSNIQLKLIHQKNLLISNSATSQTYCMWNAFRLYDSPPQLVRETSQKGLSRTKQTHGISVY